MLRSKTNLLLHTPPFSLYEIFFLCARKEMPFFLARLTTGCRRAAVGVASIRALFERADGREYRHASSISAGFPSVVSTLTKVLGTLRNISPLYYSAALQIVLTFGSSSLSCFVFFFRVVFQGRCPVCGTDGKTYTEWMALFWCPPMDPYGDGPKEP